MKLIIKGRIPSKKNSRMQIRLPNGRRINIPSADYTRWHKKASLQIKEQNPIKYYGDITGIEICFWMPDNRKADLSNKTESVMDLLVDNKVIRDDSWQYIKHIILSCEGIDRENPRAEIIIKV